QTHEVLTAVAVAENGRLEQALDVSRVTFRSIERQTLEAYVATGEPLDKAGAYAIQGLGAPLIERVEGDFFGVMGLPLRLALDLLAKFGRPYRSEEHTSELQSRSDLVCRLLLEKKNLDVYAQDCLRIYFFCKDYLL